MFSGFRALAIHGNVHQTVKLIKVLLVQGVCGDSPEKDMCSIKSRSFDGHPVLISLFNVGCQRSQEVLKRKRFDTAPSSPGRPLYA